MREEEKEEKGEREKETARQRMFYLSTKLREKTREVKEVKIEERK